jgi:hypothetical protein
MADSKISALTGASTPLAGTEVLPIVQSGATVKVAVSALTAGRAVSAASMALSTGSLVPSTAGQGINFTANTAAAGMTSQLLNWYEEGTWTPTDASGATLSLTINSASYVRVGSLVNLFCSITYPTTADVTNSKIGGFPFTSGSVIAGIGASYGNVKGLNIYGVASTTSAFLLLQNATNITNATLSGLTVVFSSTYKV